MWRRARIPDGASRRPPGFTRAVVLALLAVALPACHDGRAFDPGWDSFPADRRERLAMARPLNAVAIPLQERLQRAGMDRLREAARREPALFTVESRRVLITHLWLSRPETLAPFTRFFACADGRPVAVAAGTLFVMERRQGIEIELHLGFAATDDPTALDDCTLRPGLLAALVRWAGIT